MAYKITSCTDDALKQLGGVYTGASDNTAGVRKVNVLLGASGLSELTVRILISQLDRSSLAEGALCHIRNPCSELGALTAVPKCLDLGTERIIVSTGDAQRRRLPLCWSSGSVALVRRARKSK